MSFGRIGSVALAVVVLSSALPVRHGKAEALLERGDYLINSIVACGNCHTPQGPGGPVPGMELAGGLVIEEPEFTVITPNITPDPETGIGHWSDQEIIAAIREGRRPDGSVIGSPMPINLYREMSDNDVKALVAYLRQVPPVKNAVRKNEYPFALPQSYGAPVASLPDVPRHDPVRYGAYLAGSLGHCIECHTPLVELKADYGHRLGAGGNEYLGPWGVSTSRNITPAGIGDWTDDQIKLAITDGISADGSPLAPPMAFAYYARLSEPDLDALVAYLRSLAPVESDR